ncbi:FIST signal transduction protein [Paradesertivirga mongoliensis]|uniref:FIST signal transduction protein n=1 Tax=Paradesertivirga mongoliensis TaxID=2100740 RepID=A0ABW4ZNQ1_9SPHI|nr:FIST N-terminal domain-containing protein [Pedobacter mongoliensis]
MTSSIIVFTDKKSGEEAGQALGAEIKLKMGDKIPQVVILFASSVYDFPALLKTLKRECKPEILVGSSSAGEFTSNDFGTDSACAIALHSTEMKFSAGLGTGIKESRSKVVDELFNRLEDLENAQYQYRSAMIFADALSGYTDEIIDLLTEKTAGTYQFFGGGAGDNANFKRTHVFLDEEAVTDSAVILEILSNKPLGIGVSHGWTPAGPKMRVTEAEGMRLISINGKSAIEVVADYAEKTNQDFDVSNPVPFFLHNVIGIEMSDGYKLRVPLVINDDGSLILASDIANGSYISFMSTDADSARKAALTATNTALMQLDGNKPNVALFFDCVATRLRLGKDFGFELNQVKDTLNEINYAGCNTYGQVARVNGQFNGFHNCTAVVCVIPE